MNTQTDQPNPDTSSSLDKSFDSVAPASPPSSPEPQKSTLDTAAYSPKTGGRPGQVFISRPALTSPPPADSPAVSSQAARPGNNPDTPDTAGGGGDIRKPATPQR